MVNTACIMANTGDKDRCPKCSGKVFEAEKISSGAAVYHKLCFVCNICSRGLDSYTFTVGPNKEILCHNCHSKAFGPSVRKILPFNVRFIIGGSHTYICFFLQLLRKQILSTLR